MVDILAKEAPTSPEDLTRFFVRFHEAKPGLVERLLEGVKTQEGRSGYEVLCEASEPLAGKTVVDLACGSGPLSAMLASRVGAAGQVIGIDLSDSELRLAQTRLSGVPNVRFLHESAQQLSLPSSSIDVVLCHAAFMLFNPVEPVVREVSRILKSGGVFAAVVSPLGETPPLHREIMSKLTAVLREEIPHFDKLSWGQPEAKTLGGLKQLFSKELNFLDEIEALDFHVITRDVPQQLPGRILPFFYYNELLSEEGAAQVKAEWQTIFERHQENDSTVIVPLPRSLFRVKKG